MSSTMGHVNGTAAPERTDPWPLKIEPDFDPVAFAKAEAIRTEAAAKADALRVEAEGKAKAAETIAEQEAEKLRLQNVRASMKLAADQAMHEERMAKLDASKAEARAAADRAERAAQDEADRADEQEKEERLAETTWKWAARGIYAAGMALAAPIQFLAFWDPDRKFMVSAPILLEGLALSLAAGAAWAVAHRRDVKPFRVGILIAALIAATVNVWHGVVDESIGLNAGIIGGIASLAGPCVLMAYEHGIAQKRDGIPSWRERRDEERQAAAVKAEEDRKAAEKEAADRAKAAEKQAAEETAAGEQARRDADRQKAHPEVWSVAESIRSARGLPFVIEAIWGEAWYRVTGSKVVGITPEIESSSKAAAARMKSASELPILGDFAQVESQIDNRVKRDGNAPDGRRGNGGMPPLRVPGDTAPYSQAARTLQGETNRQVRAAKGDASREGETE
ncbi:SPFH domain-containing protein [Streptomyces xanthophaeus]|uniref:hypothetical protein n=1 Tax=Streptomyces xanthophaeus TaxID=67385 RepID=UPI0037234864